MNEPVESPRQELPRYAKVQLATESTFAYLLETAHKIGLVEQPVLGLMYLPDERVVTQFQQACRAVLDLLKPFDPRDAKATKSIP